MLGLSATIRRCQWLLVLLTIGVVATLPILNTANACFVLAESSESLSEAEDVELDEPLNLIASLCGGPNLPSPQQQDVKAEGSPSTSSVLAAIHFERGPPRC